MRNRNLINAYLAVITLFISVVGYILLQNYQTALQFSNYLTGWILLILLFLLGSFNLYKKLPRLRLGRASTWLLIHTYLGILTFMVFVMHIDFSWPSGQLNSILGYIFICQSSLGVIGLILSRTVPATLTAHGENVIYERINEHITMLREKVETAILESIKETNSTSIAEFYNNHLASYMNKPNNKLAHIVGSKRWLHKLLLETNTLSRYLDDKEKQYLNVIVEIIHSKNNLDFQSARQGLLKQWLFLHIPLTSVLIIIALLHMIIIYSFTGGSI